MRWHFSWRLAVPLAGLAVLGGALALAAQRPAAEAAGWGGYTEAQVEQESARVSYVVFHAVDRDGFCDAAAFGATSLHPVLTDAPNDTMPNATTGDPSPRATLDVYIDSGDGVIVETNMGPVGGVRSITGLKTFSTYDNSLNILGLTPIRAFPPLQKGIPDECQAWVKVVSSLGQPANVLLFFHDDAGDLGFDRVVNAPKTTTLQLTSRWSLISWPGADGIPVADALAAKGDAKGGTDISAMVTAVYAWDGAAGQWLAYFPGSGTVPGANTLTTLKAGQAYWIGVTAAAGTQWTVRTP